MTSVPNGPNFQRPTYLHTKGRLVHTASMQSIEHDLKSSRDPDAIVALHADGTRFCTHVGVQAAEGGSGPAAGRDVMTTADQLPLVTALPVEHLFDMHVDLQSAQPIPTPLGSRMTFITTGGAIDGPKLRGELLPGGGDWLVLGTDGVGRVDVRATIRTHDGALIHYESRGVIKIPADGVDRLATGEFLPFDETYVRTTPTFETADERYAWLSGVVALGYNVLSPDVIDYRVYRVL